MRAVAPKLADKLLAVRLIRSGIGADPKVRKTLAALGLKKMNQTAIHKAVPTVMGRLEAVMKHVEVRPIRYTGAVSTGDDDGYCSHEWIVENCPAHYTTADGSPAYLDHDGNVHGVADGLSLRKSSD